ncbi:UDP-N-acetylmuramate--L-alanine ligase [Parafilimonas terrae]|uniref:UDP-N-acetylmuramate--alanine ligase n=1 Tax=Parafilimonas terrae TaxID=1465490 RepID=A0A1I5SEF8_9BACT|nr:Mur ligase family protein [Parafilimonas terrae]SFP69103.1 UDP-N-acetylmuramate--alanine ligase [Parafilimonas terrae]
MITSINDFKNVFFIGIAGTGMSALAQYLKSINKNVSGSDRYFKPGEPNETKSKLEAEGISCFLQNGEGLNSNVQLVIVSAAVEDTVPEVQKAKHLNIPVMKRSELLALITQTKKTIAVGGTSGKSTTVAMLFEILEHAGLQPGLISGAGLTRLIKQGKIGNAKAGNGEWLIIEADESDGSIVQYRPSIGILLNVDKDHKDYPELIKLFAQFKNNSETFIVNRNNKLASALSQNIVHDFSADEKVEAGYTAKNFQQHGFEISFAINQAAFSLHVLGKHNGENALAAIAAANIIGVDLNICANALQHYEGIYRRHQVIGNKKGVWLVDDYAHNPAKCAASIKACQPVAEKLIAWFQPHGYTPTKFLREDYVREIAAALRPQDEIWMSEIFYAGGTALKDISANDLINDIKTLHKHAFFIENRNDFPDAVQSHLSNDCVILLMGARDPSLEKFAQYVWDKI